MTLADASADTPPPMRLGICLAAYGPGDLGAALAEAGKHGAVCLDLPTDTTLGLVDGRRCAEDRAYLDDAVGVLTSQSRTASVTCVSNSRDVQLLLGPHGPHTDPVLTGSPADKRAHAVRCALGTIRLAEQIGAPAVRFQPGCPDFGRWLSWRGSDVSWADNVAKFFDIAEPLLRAARAAGVMFLLEPHVKQVVYDRASAELVFQAGSEWGDMLGLCVDPANLAATGFDPVASVRGWGSRLVAIHAKDLEPWSEHSGSLDQGWVRYGPQPPIRFRALGSGILDWPKIIVGLVREGFGGIIYVEHEDTLLPAHRGVGQALRLLRELLSTDSG